MRRSDQPNRPSATIWWCLSSAKTLLMSRRSVPRRRQRLEPLLEMAGFQLSINGRFWVSTEGIHTDCISRHLVRQVAEGQLARGLASGHGVALEHRVEGAGWG